jgi:hypothetical protein
MHARPDDLAEALADTHRQPCWPAVIHRRSLRLGSAVGVMLISPDGEVAPGQ